MDKKEKETDDSIFVFLDSMKKMIALCYRLDKIGEDHYNSGDIQKYENLNNIIDSMAKEFSTINSYVAEIISDDIKKTDKISLLKLKNIALNRQLETCKE